MTTSSAATDFEPMLTPSEKYWDVPRIEFLGDEGQFAVAYGHIDSLTFIILAIAEYARTFGFELLEELLEGPYAIDIAKEADKVEQTYATQQNEEGFDPWLRWGIGQKDEPGAFPITLWVTH